MRKSRRWAPWLRIVMARHPWMHWVVVATLAVAVGVAVASSVADVRRQRESWGTTTVVLVATRAVAPGEPMAGAYAPREVPLAMAPAAARASLTPTATATQRIAAGEVIVDIDVTAAGGPSALLPDGWLAIEIDDAGGGSALDPQLFHVGDPAWVLADGTVAADAAVIVAVNTAMVVVGVPSGFAARVADAANRHAAVVALSH